MATAEGTLPGREVRFASGAQVLAGSLLLPPEGTAPWATAVFLHDSGPQDRNGDSPQAPLHLFAALAEDLASSGCASVRYDKRGCGQSSGDAAAASVEDLAEDGAAAVRFARRLHETARRPVFLVGHSEGTVLALMLAARDPKLAGLVLLAPQLTPMREVLRLQAAALQRAIEAMPPQERLRVGVPHGYDQRQVTEQFIAAVEAAPAEAAVAQVMGQTVPVRWFRSHFALDIRALVPHVRCPLLAVGGAKDAQVPPQDAVALAELARSQAPGNPDATAVVVPDLTHILRRSHGRGDLSEYPALAQSPVDEGVRQLVVEWVGGHRPQPEADARQGVEQA